MTSSTISKIEKEFMMKKHIKKRVYLHMLKKISIFFRLYGLDYPDINLFVSVLSERVMEMVDMVRIH